MQDNNVHNLHVERAFRDAMEVGASVAAEARDWDHSYTLKEANAVMRELIERIEPDDVEKLYPLGLRLFTLCKLFAVKLLEADARGEFDGKDTCEHDRAVWEQREGGLFWCRECQEYLERTEDGWKHKKLDGVIAS